MPLDGISCLFGFYGGLLRGGSGSRFWYVQVCFSAFEAFFMRLKSFIGHFVLVSAVLILGKCDCPGDVAFLDGWTNAVYVTGGVAFTLLPGQSFSFVPSSVATNEISIDVGGASTTFDLQDGCLYSVNFDGSVQQESVIRSSADDDSVLAGYFVNGLELGTGSAVVLFGFLAVRRALRLGDVVE